MTAIGQSSTRLQHGGEQQQQVITFQWSTRQTLQPHKCVPLVQARHIIALKSRQRLVAKFPRYQGRCAVVVRNAVEEAALAANSDSATNGASKLSTSTGRKHPLGPSPVGANDVNFALYAPAATSVSLCLFHEDGSLLQEIPVQSKSEGVWHIEVQGLGHVGVLYGYKVNGQGGWETTYRWDGSKVLLDPYAPLVKGRAVYGKRDEFEQFKQVDGSVFRGTFDFQSAPFDWGADYKKPNLHLKDLVIYEVPIRTFTADPSSGVPEGHAGTFAGMKAKIPYLKELGINAVEVLPVFEFDELEFQRVPNPRQHMVNIWGYSHLSFFAPMSRYASEGKGPASASREFKELVKAFHDEGIEVILDVVYNHTVEGGDDLPYLLSWRGIDCPGYYMMDKEQFVQLLNYSGCGNTVNANAEAMKNMIFDSLKHWVLEYHVDGFRFDLASALCRDPKGHVMDCPPLIRQITKDEVLSKVKLLAEPWDIGSYMLGKFPNWDIWAEWNGKYRDDVRRFMKGDPGMKPALATRIAGSADLYNVNNRKPYHSINFIIAHDGFTLYDLVAYNSKHNSDNGEQNRDGSNDNFSWNCGWEGETGDPNVNALRWRQMKNFHLVLMISAGTPMVLSGDEYGATRYGNNNWYGHDTTMTWFKWEQMEKQKDAFWRYYSGLIKFRLETPMLRKDNFMGPGDVTWHETMWDNFESKFLAFTLHDKSDTTGSLYAAFNAHEFQVTVSIPPPPGGRQWCRIVDTNLESPRDFTPDNTKPLGDSYIVQPWSSLLLQAKRV